MSDSAKALNVMVVGAAGGIGKALCLLLASSGITKKLVLVDLAPTTGLAMELSHIDKGCEVKSQTINECDTDLDVILMPCGKPQSSSGEKRDDLFKINAGIFENIMNTVAPKMQKLPIYIVIGNPVNSLTVVCAEALKKLGKYDPKRLLGFNELDAMRSRRFVSDVTGVDAANVDCPIIGGHSEKTIFPVVDAIVNSATGKAITLTSEQKTTLFDDVRFAGDRVLAAYDNKGTSILSTAYSAFNLVYYLTQGSQTTRYCYVEHGLTSCPGLPKFFTVPVRYSLEKGAIVSDVAPLIAKLSDDQKKTLFAEVEANIKAAHYYFASK